jgi:SPX domain protein involved in polyphosphate accumulation
MVRDYIEDQSNNFRYERKFLISHFSHSEIEQIIKFHPACFSRLFPQRSINNIYFDTFGFEHYFENVEGDTDRIKMRIRWYGDTFGEIRKPKLEYKIKKGLLGRKETFDLNPFLLDKNFSKDVIIKALDRPDIPNRVRNELMSVQPSLLNSYKRNYFLSANKKFRVTVDHDMSYHRISYGGNNFITRSTEFDRAVMELKYNRENEEEAKQVGAMFPFTLTKNSKYLRGVDRTLM